ncbi:cysteine rich repeat-containing protein [Rhizobium herbae]
MSTRTRLIGGTLVAFLALAGAARADTISFADAVSTLATDCGTDIKKFCKGLNLGNGRIQNCLEEHAGKVSPTCTATLSSVSASIKQRLAAQSSFTASCKHDVAQFCSGVKGEGNVLSCLNKAKRVKEGQCGQTITDSGWR